jgi:GT2 family glycosyltransferase
VHPQPLVAVAILNYNGRSYLEKFLPSVLSSTYTNKEIYVADNASTDDSMAWLVNAYPAIKIITLTENYGFAKGYNEALKQVVADYYVLLNSDVEVTPNWIEPVISLMQADKKIAACQPKILAYNNRNLFEYAGACGGWIDSLGYPFSRGRVFDVCEEDKGQYDETSRIFWATGAAMFVRASVYKTLNGLDPYFFAHQEEIDLCWRMQLAGYKIMSCPQSVVYHVGGGTLPKGERKAFLNFRNNLVMIYKNWPLHQKLWKLPVRFLLDMVSALKSLASGDMLVCKGVFKAWVMFIGWIFSDKKQNIFPAERRGELSGVYKGSIVWQYFIKKKKTFAEIVFETE